MIVKSRDVSILKMCVEQKFMTLEQISKMFFPSSENVLQVPMKRVRILVNAGFLKSVKLRVNEKRLYVATSEAVSLLRSRRLSGGLGPIKELNDKTWEHDEKVTDIRIIFEKLFGFPNWTSERILEQKNVGKKVPDGIAWDKQDQFIIEVERHLKNKRYYERVFFQMFQEYQKNTVLYILENESDLKWLMAQAKDWDMIYFSTLKDFEEIDYGISFKNAAGKEIYWERMGRGGALFPEIRHIEMETEEEDDDDGFDEMRADDEKFRRWREEDEKALREKQGNQKRLDSV